MPVVVRVSGIREAISRIDRFVRVSLRALTHEVGEVTGDIVADVSAYPPESEANRPKYGSWGPYYIRGAGSAYKSKSGQVSVYGGSEQLGSSWSHSSTRRGNVIEGRAENPTSYFDYVHGKKQTAFHRRRGWKNLYEVVQNRAALSVKRLTNAVARLTERV